MAGDLNRLTPHAEFSYKSLTFILKGHRRYIANEWRHLSFCLNNTLSF